MTIKIWNQIQQVLLVSCLFVNAHAMENSPQDILQRIESLRDEYCGRSRWLGIAQGSFPAPESPINYLDSIKINLEDDGFKKINHLCLMVAHKDSCHELFQILLDAGVDLDYQEKGSGGCMRSMLEQACRAQAPRGKTEPEFKNAKLLLARGAKAQIPYKFSSRAEHKPAAVFLLLQHGARLRDVWEAEKKSGT